MKCPCLIICIVVLLLIVPVDLSFPIGSHSSQNGSSPINAGNAAGTGQETPMEMPTRGISGLPQTRPFYLGMTPMPYNYTSDALNDTYDILAEHCDMVTHHFDMGVPWPEAYSGTPYPPAVLADIKTRLENTTPGQKVYLALTPINGTRDGMGGYWADGSNLPRPGIWASKDFDDPMVIKAYANFCRYMVLRFDPDYLCYGIEANILAQTNPAAFSKYLVLTERVYWALKSQFPDLPVFLSIHIDTYYYNKTAQTAAIGLLFPYTDYVAVSTYTFTHTPDPANLPATWFSQMSDMAPQKPFAIAETGFIAEDLYLPAGGIDVDGSPEWQAEYVELVLNSTDALGGEFVTWFVPRDYDYLWDYWGAAFPWWAGLWKDTGLQDGDGNDRTSLDVWDTWRSLHVINGNLSLPSDGLFAVPPKENRVLPIYTGTVDNLTLDYFNDLAVGGMVINSWDWNKSLLDHADSLGLTLWANDYYMYPSGNANPMGGVHEKLWNPGFETSRLGMWPDGWVWTYYDWPVYDVTGTQSHTGTDCVAADDMNSFFWPIGVTPGSKYNISVWARAQPGSTYGRVVVIWQNVTKMVSFYYSVFPVTSSYERYSLEVTAPPGANVAKILLQGNERTKFVWFDDVMIWNVTAPPVNQLMNPGFEADVAAPMGVPDNWMNISAAPTYDTSGTKSHTGTDAVQVNSTNILLQGIVAAPGQDYYYGMWIKGTTGGEWAQTTLLFMDAGFNMLGGAANYMVVNTTYVYHDIIGTAPPQTAFVLAAVASAGDTYFIWADDVFLTMAQPLNQGVSRGPVLDGHPELEAQGLYYNSQDVTSPATSNLEVPPGKLVSAVAVPVLSDGSLTLTMVVINVTSYITGGHVVWSPSSGKWRVMAFAVNILYNGTEVDPAITNMHQINVMNPTAVQSFINVMYDDTIRQGTGDYFGGMVKASFTDEVSSLAGYFLHGEKYPVVAWLDDPVNGHHITTEFNALHGYGLVPVLPALFNDCGPMTGKYRMDFYNTTGWLQGQGYYRMIGDWCEANGFNFSGHPLGEDSPLQQTAFYGDVFECLKHEGIPGMDALLRVAGLLDPDLMVPKLISSAAVLYGKEHTMTEYSVHASSMNYRNMTAVVNWGAVQGIDTLTSFSFYTGVVPDKDLRNHSLHVGRTNYMLGQGRYDCDIAVLYPVDTMQAEFVPRTDVIWDRQLFGGYSHEESFKNLTKALLSNQLDFVYINDENLGRCAIDNSSGEAVLAHATSRLKFRVLIVPEMDAISNISLQMIKRFYDGGGLVISVGDLPFMTDELGEAQTVVAQLKAIWDNSTVGPNGYSERTSPGNGKALWADGDWQAVIDAILDFNEPDLRIIGTPEPTLYYRKQVAEGFYVYFLVNNKGTPVQHTYELKGLGVPSFWNPETGAMVEAGPSDYSYDTVTGYTLITNRNIPGFSSVFIILKRPVISLLSEDIVVAPAVPILGMTATITANITNLGYGETGTMGVKCFIGSTQVDSTKPLSLLPQQKGNVAFSWNTAGYAGDNNMTIVVEIMPDQRWEAVSSAYVNTPPVPMIWCKMASVLTLGPVDLSANLSSDIEGISAYHWDLGDGNASTAMAVTHSYSDDGDYLVVLTVTDTHNVSRTASRTIPVANRAPAARYSGGPLSGNVTTVFAFNASSSSDMDGTIVNYTWDTGSGDKRYGRDVKWTYSAPGRYEATLTVRDDDGAEAEISFNISVLNLGPRANFTVEPAAGNVTTAFSFKANASDPDGTVTGYCWDFGDGTNSTQAGPAHTFPDDREYTVSLRVKDDLGAWSANFSSKLGISNLPPSAGISASDPSEAGISVNFSAIDIEDPDDDITELAFARDYGDRGKAAGMNASHAFAAAGRYNVTLNVTDDDGASAKTVRSMTITPKAADDDDIVQVNDTDDDGLPDAWEMEHFGDLDENASGDYDKDGYTNGREYLDGTDPVDPNDPAKPGDDDDDTGPGAMLWVIIGAIMLVILIIGIAAFLLIRRSKKEGGKPEKERIASEGGDKGDTDTSTGAVGPRKKWQMLEDAPGGDAKAPGPEGEGPSSEGPPMADLGDEVPGTEESMAAVPDDGGPSTEEPAGTGTDGGPSMDGPPGACPEEAGSKEEGAGEKDKKMA